MNKIDLSMIIGTDLFVEYQNWDQIDLENIWQLYNKGS